MGVFSRMSEDEIQKRQAEQDERHRDQERREADLKRRSEQISDEEGRLAKEWAEFKTQRTLHAESLAKSRKELADLELALSLKQAEAKAGFTKQQMEAFHETVEMRGRQLDARQQQIEDAEKRLLASVAAREAACGDRERRLDLRDAEALKQHKSLQDLGEELRIREERVAKAEQERDAGFAESRRVLDLELRAERQQLESRAAQLREREEQVFKAEQERDAGYVELRRLHDAQQHARWQQTEKELANRRAQSLSELQAELAEERRRRRDELSREIDLDRSQANAQLLAQRKAFEQEQTQARAAAKQAEERTNQREADLTAKEHAIDYRDKALTAWEAKLGERKRAIDEEVEQRVVHRQKAMDTAEAQLEQRRQALEEEVEAKVADRRVSLERREETFKLEFNRLRSQIQTADRTIGLFESLKRQLGGKDPELLLTELETHQSALRDLREQLAQRPAALREELDAIRAERDRLRFKVEAQTQDLAQLQDRMRGEDTLRLELQAAEDRGKMLTSQAGMLEGRCNQLEEENKRLRAAYEREEDREARIRDIETPELTALTRRQADVEVDEVEWLNGIAAACSNYGLRFHPRILKAFHTSLKTAEWSPLTILAGVSGTGKSELPRLYSHFGGMTFKSLPVQPNWDSQESMLGFFNSIDNKFDAQPVLRLLARSQQPWTDKNHGLKDSMVMILLDEMNLAHAELYFAEFLSKLELRRGCQSDIPSLEVKLGAGLQPYLLPMGRNVLWTGTMNQDETTKALSDKVLDRSIVIHFPRPDSLERRKQLKPLPAAAPLLPRKVWQSWWMRESGFDDAEIAPFKGMIEDINRAMSKVGRALGHRVWQSVEYYMANYPDTRAAKTAQERRQAMRIAFEDQLVQKVMPKLRGIETRGRGMTDCLEKVRDLLIKHEYAILDDFKLSCECGYGQFIWQTVSFLQEPAADPPSDEVPEVTATPTQSDKTPVDLTSAPAEAEDEPQTADTAADVGPPSRFMPYDADRARKWKRLSLKQREKWQKGEGDEQR